MYGFLRVAKLFVVSVGNEFFFQNVHAIVRLDGSGFPKENVGIPAVALAYGLLCKGQNDRYIT